MNFFLIFFAFLLSLTELAAAEPLKVPIERYQGSYDKRNHPGHYPFISYLTFRNMCDIVIDDATEWFDPDQVKQGDTIYLNIWYLEWFVKHVHNEIKHPYILVTCDVGAWLPDPEFKQLLYDPKLAAWFCRNMVFSYHPKLFQIPTGQDFGQFVLDDPHITSYLLDSIAKKTLPKEHLLYMCHFPRTHGERDQLVKLFENEPYCLSRNYSDQEFVGVTRPKFYEELASCQFVLSPLGLETDSVRTWEGLVLDCIPIVEHTFLDASYDNLPVVMVHDWREVNPEFLEKKYQKIKDRKCDEAYFDYWATLIKNVQTKIRKNEHAFSQLEATQFSPQDLESLVSILNEKEVENRLIFCKGFLSTLHCLQLANAISTPIFLYDPWIDKEFFTKIDEYLIDKSFLINKRNVLLLDNENHFSYVININAGYSVFLDLTYYRTSLFLNFRMSLIEYGNFRQSLKQDLTKLYNELAPNALLCGNMVNNEYVKEVLEMFCKENYLTMQTKGSFWSFVKKE